MAVDILIKGGLVVDGTGTTPYYGNVAIKNGRVVGVGDVKETAGRVINADGLVVSPGFWDVHTHYDAQLLWDPIATSSCWHGVTTVVMGNCGFTIAPCRAEDQEWLVKTLARVEGMDVDVLHRTLPWRWTDFKGYLDTLDQSLGVNAVAQVGHTALRRYVMGAEASEREAKPEELKEMTAVLTEGLAAGGMGFSTSRIVTHWDGDGLPVPSRLASMEEYIALVGQLVGVKAGFVQAAGMFDAEKWGEIGRLTGLPVCWNAIVAGPNDPEGWRDRLEALRQLCAQGVDAFALGHCMPTDREFDFRYTNVFDRWERWQKILIEPHERKKTMLKDSAIRQSLKEEMESDPIPQVPVKWDKIIVAHSSTGKYAGYEGQRLSELAEKVGRHPQDIAFDVALDEDLNTHFRLLDARELNEDAMLSILKSPHVVPGMSDAGAHTITEVNTGFPTHLLGYWVRERQAFELEEAVQILASRPANNIGVTDRGYVAQGMAADIVLFDPLTVRPKPKEFVYDLPGGGRRLSQGAEGVEYTLVNGTVTTEGGKATGDLAGSVIRSSDFS